MHYKLREEFASQGLLTVTGSQRTDFSVCTKQRGQCENWCWKFCTRVTVIYCIPFQKDWSPTNNSQNCCSSRLLTEIQLASDCFSISKLYRSIHNSVITLHKNPAKTQGMHFVSVKHWNIETHKLYRKINFWRITKSKTSPKGSIVSVVSKLWNTLKMMKIAEHFNCFETNWNKPHFWCFETFLKRTETWQKLTNVSVFLKRFETKLKQEENWLSPNVSVVSKQNWNKLWKR